MFISIVDTKLLLQKAEEKKVSSVVWSTSSIDGMPLLLLVEKEKKVKTLQEEMSVAKSDHLSTFLMIRSGCIAIYLKVVLHSSRVQQRNRHHRHPRGSGVGSCHRSGRQHGRRS